MIGPVYQNYRAFKERKGRIRHIDPEGVAHYRQLNGRDKEIHNDRMAALSVATMPIVMGMPVSRAQFLKPYYWYRQWKENRKKAQERKDLVDQVHKMRQMAKEP